MNTIIKHNSPNLQNTQSISYAIFDSFCNYLEASPKTIETYRKAINQFIKYLYENDIKQPTRADLINYRESLKVNHKPTTVQNYITAVRLFFQWTAEEGLYPNIADHLKGAKLNREHKKDYLTPAQIRDIISHIDTSTLTGKRDYAIFVLMVTCGLRTIEVSRANIEDIRTVGRNTVLYIQGKGREEKAEYVKLNINTERAIRDYLKARGEKDSSKALFSSTSNNSINKPLSTRTISGIVKGLMVSNGYDSDRLTAHSLRHTAVTLALIGGEKLEEVQQFARHSNISTTQIYAHNLEKANNSCANTIANAIF